MRYGQGKQKAKVLKPGTSWPGEAAEVSQKRPGTSPRQEVQVLLWDGMVGCGGLLVSRYLSLILLLCEPSTPSCVGGTWHRSTALAVEEV